MGIMVPKKTAIYEDVSFGVCVWQMPDGSFVKDDQGNYFCVQGKVGSRNIELKMQDAAKFDLGITVGKPVWFPGFRQITQGEWEDQMERLIDGKVPDAVDLFLQQQ